MSAYQDTFNEKTSANMCFCDTCNNMLFPEMDVGGALRWRCGFCGVDEAIDDPELRVLHVLNVKKVSDTAGDTAILTELVNDPTAQRVQDRVCKKCKQSDLRRFINPFGGDGLVEYVVCANKNCRYVEDSKQSANPHNA